MDGIETRHYLIFYDICDPKRLRKVAEWIENFAYRVQLSVFEAELDEKTFNKLLKGLKPLIDDIWDSVYIIPICSSDWKRRERYGATGMSEMIYNQSCVVL